LQLLRVHLQWSSFFLCGCCIIINLDHLMRTTFTVLLFLLVLQGYVVYLGDADPALHSDSVKANHHNILSSAVGSLGAAENAMLYSYRNVFNGFSAHLSAEEFSLLSDCIPHTLGSFLVWRPEMAASPKTHCGEKLSLELM
jgi:hypothetical protein